MTRLLRLAALAVLLPACFEEDTDTDVDTDTEADTDTDTDSDSDTTGLVDVGLFGVGPTSMGGDHAELALLAQDGAVVAQASFIVASDSTFLHVFEDVAQPGVPYVLAWFVDADDDDACDEAPTDPGWRMTVLTTGTPAAAASGTT